MENSANKKGQVFVKVGVIGNVDSGKSTLVGVLSKGLRDDGRGEARSHVFNFAHEQANGRTSSMAQEIMGFDGEGRQVLPERAQDSRQKQHLQVMAKASKVLTFLDLCGHEKYLKTTMYGLVSTEPDYALLAIGSNMGVARMTREHLGLSLALKIPCLVALTKTDLSPAHIVQQTLQTVVRLLKHPQVNKSPVVVREQKDLERLALLTPAQQKRVVPIFLLSSVDGTGIEVLTAYLAALQTQTSPGQPAEESLEFNLTESFQVTGVGTVVNGMVRRGVASVNQSVLLGPDRNQQFRPVVIKGIHVNRLAVQSVQAGQLCCLLIKSKTKEKLSRRTFRKGMFLVGEQKPESVWSFRAQVSVLHHSSTIKEGYQCQVHSRVIRQSVRVDGIHQQEGLMRTGDTCLVDCSFMYNSEYLRQGDTVIFREGRTKLQGSVISVGQDTNT